MESFDTNVTVVEENNTKNKSGREIDIREVGGFLLSKLWIIALVVLCFIIIAFLYTELITPMYSATRSVYISNKSTANLGGSYDEEGVYGQDLSVAIQLTKSSEEIFTKYGFCASVADALNKLDLDDEIFNKHFKNEEFKTFLEFYKSNIDPEGTGKITPETVMSCISIASDEEKCTVSFTATTPSPELSDMISDAATALCMEDYLNEINGSYSKKMITVGLLDEGSKLPTNPSPSNKHPLRNMIIGAVLGFVLICAILVCFFIFDDKIKVPDDIQKHLKLNVLGEIPEIEEA